MKLPLEDIKPNPNNPRLIKDGAYKKLIQSLIDLPKMAEVREIVNTARNYINQLGGFEKLAECGIV